MTSSSSVQRQQEMNQKGFKVTNSGHVAIYCSSMLLSTVALILENDALAMRLAS